VAVDFAVIIESLSIFCHDIWKATTNISNLCQKKEGNTSGINDRPITVGSAMKRSGFQLFLPPKKRYNGNYYLKFLDKWGIDGLNCRKVSRTSHE
jgi:hypothetical protein